MEKIINRTNKENNKRKKERRIWWTVWGWWTQPLKKKKNIFEMEKRKKVYGIKRNWQGIKWTIKLIEKRKKNETNEYCRNKMNEHLNEDSFIQSI